MREDDVLRQVRAAREEYARSHGFDVRAMVADLKERDECGDWPVVWLEPRRPQPRSDEDAERAWDEQMERDERAGRLDALMDRAIEEHRAGRTRPL